MHESNLKDTALIRLKQQRDIENFALSTGGDESEIRQAPYVVVYFDILDNKEYVVDCGSKQHCINAILCNADDCGEFPNYRIEN